MNVLYCKRHRQLALVAWACPESDGFCNAVPMRLIPDNVEPEPYSAEWMSRESIRQHIEEVSQRPYPTPALDGETP